MAPIRDDGTCVFGAIDIDVYKSLDLAQIAQDLMRYEFLSYRVQIEVRVGHIFTASRARQWQRPRCGIGLSEASPNS